MRFGEEELEIIWYYKWLELFTERSTHSYQLIRGYTFSCKIQNAHWNNVDVALKNGLHSHVDWKSTRRAWADSSHCYQWQGWGAGRGPWRGAHQCNGYYVYVTLSYQRRLSNAIACARAAIAALLWNPGKTCKISSKLWKFHAKIHEYEFYAIIFSFNKWGKTKEIYTHFWYEYNSTVRWLPVLTIFPLAYLLEKHIQLELVGYLNRVFSDYKCHIVWWIDCGVEHVNQ